MSALAPNASTLPPSLPLLPGGLWLEQLLGTGGELVEGIMTCTGTEEAFSPATVMSAVATGPHTYPSRNTRHSSKLFCWGSVIVSTEDTMRKPGDPVSTST